MDSSLTSQAIAPAPVSALPSRRPRGIVVAGGQLLVRAARHSVLARAGLEVVADVSDSATAAEVAQLLRPGIVLVDLQIPGGCVRAVRRIVEQAPHTAVLVIAPELDCESMLAAIRAGAAGFVSETLGVRSLIRAVEVALGGETVVPRSGVSSLIEQLRGTRQVRTSVVGRPLRLTRREIEVAARFREGMTPKEIACELRLSAVTVRRHLSSVARKARQARPLTLALESTS